MPRVDDCPVCAGRGLVDALHIDQPTPTREIQTCPRCLGTGALIVRENP
jgi:DnaJ-class molecular chaperone